MATHYMSIGNNLSPDDGGNVHFESAQAINGSFIWDNLLLTFNDASSDMAAYGSFVVPGNYVGGPKINVWFFSTATSGNCRWRTRYAVMSANNTLTEAAAETETVNQAISGTQWGWTKCELALTAGNLSAGDKVVFFIMRHGSNAGDTIAADVHLAQLVFEYTD